jgi:uncharacterized protein (TIGR03083 family)
MTDFDDREQAAYERTDRLFRDVDPQLRVGDGTWSAHDVLAHLVTVVRRYTSIPELAETPRGVDEINAKELAALTAATTDALLADYGNGFSAYREVWTQVHGDHRWPFHGGGQLDTTAVRSNWLAEMLIHGYDVAAAAGVDWPISEPDAVDILMLVQAIVPTYARAGTPTALEVAPDGLPAWSLRITPDGATVGGAAGCDASISGPPEVLVLFFYQRFDLAAATARGARVTGDADALTRVMAQLERP